MKSSLEFDFSGVSCVFVRLMSPLLIPDETILFAVDCTCDVQCMKFATHTKMVAAQFSDLMVATNQGTTTGFTMVGQGNFGQFPKAADGSMDAHFHRWWSNKNPDNSYKERKNEKSNAFKMNAIFLTGSIIYFVLASLWFYSTSVRANKKLKEPLMELDPTDYNDAMNVMHRDHESRSKEEFSPPKMVAVTAMKIY